MLHNYGCKSRTYYQDKQTNGGLFALFLLIFLVFVQESRQNSPILSVCPRFLAPEVVKGMQRCRLQRHERRPLIFSEVVSSTSEVVLFFSPEFGLSNRPFSLDNLEVKLRFLGQEMIGCDGCYKIDAESIETPMAGVFNLHDIL